jgi:hypothetical protein
MHTEKETPMNRLTYSSIRPRGERLLSRGLALASLALLGSALPALAAQSPENAPPRVMVPFKATMIGVLNSSDRVIPADPPVIVGQGDSKGTADALGGAVTYLDTHLIHLGVDGNSTRATNGVGVFTGPTGDALFITWDGVPRPTATPGVVQTFGGFTITGGRGKFAGVTGSGMINGTLDFTKNPPQGTDVYEGLIAFPPK